jgi:hypothetical protein
MYKTRLLFLSTEVIFQLKEREIQHLQAAHPHIIFSKEKRKKKKAIYQVEGCKDARAVRYEPFIYPCIFVSPELTFAPFFILLG